MTCLLLALYLEGWTLGFERASTEALKSRSCANKLESVTLKEVDLATVPPKVFPGIWPTPNIFPYIESHTVQ